jgi:hypothetical protein
MNSLWFRLYTDLPNCPKLRRLPPDVQLAYVWFLCLHKEGQLVGASVADIAWRLRMADPDVERAIIALQAANLLADDRTPTGWDERQFQSDSSTSRVRSFRAKHAGNVPAKQPSETSETLLKRPGNVAVTPQSRAETDTETEQTQTARAHEEPPQPTPDQTGPATQLLSLLQSTGAWNHRDHGFTALAELGRLIEARGERETLDEARWYAEHHGDRYAPSICGIRDLDKWPKIRAAMARHAQESRLADNGLSLLDEADRLEREREAKK